MGGGRECERDRHRGEKGEREAREDMGERGHFIDSNGHRIV